MTEQSPKNTSKNYNKVYESLVTSEDDIVGFIAYGLYKKSKQKYITTFEQKYSKRPSDEDISIHVSCSELPSLDNYRAEAKRLLELLLEQAVSDKEAKLEEIFQKRLWRYVKDHEPPSWIDKIYTFIKSSFSGVLGNFFTTVIVILVLYSFSSSVSKENLAYGAKENFISGIAKAFGVETIKVQPSVTNPTEK